MSNYEFVTKTSKDAINIIPNELDFVYIDGNHDYEYVKEDINIWYSKVKEGGIIGGNDFDAGHFGVVRAVLEFVEKNNLTLYGDIFDWWIIKEK